MLNYIFMLVFIVNIIIISYITKETYNVMMVLKAKLKLFPGMRQWSPSLEVSHRRSLYERLRSECNCT